MSIGAISGGPPDLSALRAQFQEAAAARFNSGDTDKSGSLSLEEFKGVRAGSPFGSANVADAPSAEELFSTLDADGDGEVTSSEFASAKPPKGTFSSEMLSSFLSLQETSRPPSILDFLTSGSEEEDDSGGNTLIDELLDTLVDNEDDSEE